MSTSTRSCCRVEDEPRLGVLPSGTVPPNPSDLLSMGRMGEVLSRLAEYADVVIIDSPPLLPVSDTRVLLRLPEVDGVIMVGRAGVSRRDRVRAANHVLDQSGRRVFGLVVTDTKLPAAERLLLRRPQPDGPQPPGRVKSPA